MAFQHNDEYNETIFSFVNNINTTDGGTHLAGFKSGLTKTVNEYGRKFGLLKDSDKALTGDDIREGITAVINIKISEPQFEGQTKTKLDNQDANRATAKVTSDEVPLFFDKNLETLKTVIGCAEKAAKIRKAEEKARTNLLTKQKFSFDSNGKLSNCESRDASKCEIFIVEGDSAGGSAKTARDRSYQAILPIRGKILNVEKASIDKVLANAEIKTMINAFGCGFSEGYGNDFDITRLRYDKIIIMADADVDGAHIRTLLLTFFFRFMRPLIEQGYVYAAVPPLYKLTRGKLTRVAFSDEERDKVSAELRGDNSNAKVDISRYKGLGEMDPHELWETTMDPEKRTLKRIELDDAVRADETFTVLMGEKVEPRKEFIEKNARYAVNLDY